MTVWFNKKENMYLFQMSLFESCILKDSFIKKSKGKILKIFFDL